MTLVIKGREFQVEKTESAPLKDGRKLPMYILRGKRGAEYATMVNVTRPDVMFLVDARGFGIPAGFEDVRLTDRRGMLEVERG